MEEDYVDIQPDDLLEVTLKESDDFLKVRETLTRIGISSKKEKKLWQSCHILHKRGKYYIVHFKELFALDGLPTNLSDNDIFRRNTIADLLEEWGLIDIVEKDPEDERVPIHHLKIIPYRDKGDWELCPKYHIGKK
tara:strand:- start:11833 stop:12240 length:408 start_codon:yes stop_codon:yes gene_type:complete